MSRDDKMNTCFYFFFKIKMDENGEPHIEGEVRKKAGGIEIPKAKKGVINLASFGMQVAVLISSHLFHAHV